METIREGKYANNSLVACKDAKGLRVIPVCIHLRRNSWERMN